MFDMEKKKNDSVGVVTFRKETDDGNPSGARGASHPRVSLRKIIFEKRKVACDRFLASFPVRPCRYRYRFRTQKGWSARRRSIRAVCNDRFSQSDLNPKNVPR